MDGGEGNKEGGGQRKGLMRGQGGQRGGGERKGGSCKAPVYILYIPVLQKSLSQPHRE